MPAPLQAASSASAAGCCAGSTGPKRSRAIVPVCAMTPGSRDRRRDVRDAAHHALGADDRADPLDALDAVLERDRRRRLRDERARSPAAALSVSQSLTREQHDVGRRERRRVVGDGGRRQMRRRRARSRRASPRSRIAARCRPRATNATSWPACASLRAEIAADAAGAHHRDAHRALPSSPPVNSDTSPACTGRPRARRCSAPACPTAASASRPASTAAAARPSRRGASAARRRRPDTGLPPVCASAHSSICAITWLANDELITYDGWPGAAAQVHEPALGEQDDPLAVREDDVVDLRLDVLPLVVPSAPRRRSRCRSGRCCTRSRCSSSASCARA